MRNKLAHLIGWLLLCTASTVLAVAFAVNEKDRLNQAYDRSHKAAANPYSSDIEADDLFDTSLGLEIGAWWWLKQQDSVMVRITRFTMRLAIVLAIPVLLYAAIKIMLSLWDDGKLQESLKQVAYVVAGMLLVLFSVMIIFLVTSLTRSSLPYFVN